MAASASTTSTSSSSATARCPSAAASPASAARPARSASSGSCTRRSGVAGPPTGRGSGVRSPSSSRRRRRSRNSRRAEHVGQLRAVGRLVDDLAQVEAVELVQVADDRPELLALERRLAVGGQRLLALGAGDPVEVLVHPLQRAELAQRSAAVLSPMPGTPWMLSPGSPLRPIRSGTSSRGTPRRVSTRSGVYTWTSATPRDHHQAHAVGDELEGVTVGGDDRRPGCPPRRRCARACRSRRRPRASAPRSCGSRTPPRQLEVRLLAQEVGHRPAVGLVVRVELEPHLGAARPRPR